MATPAVPQRAVGMTDLTEGQIVRILKGRSAGALAATQEYIAGKGLWRLRLPKGDPVEEPPHHIKALDQEDLYAVGQVVRIANVGLLSAGMKIEGQLVAVQEYLPMKDAWNVLTPQGQKYELYKENLKNLDDPDMFTEQEMVRLTGLPLGSGFQYNNQIASVQQYEQLKDSWKVILKNAEKLDVYSENMKKVRPDAFAEGDLVCIKGSTDPVIIQQYVTDADMWRVILQTGKPSDQYAENLRKPGEADNAAGDAFERFAKGGGGTHAMNMAQAGLAKAGGVVAGVASSGAAAVGNLIRRGSGQLQREGTGTGGLPNWRKMLMKKKLTSAGYSSMEGGKGPFVPEDMVHICGLKGPLGTGPSDGTIAMLQEFDDAKKKWKIRLNTGKQMQVSADNLRPTANPEEFTSGQLVRLDGTGKTKLDGKTAAVQQCVEAKGMWKVRLPDGAAADIWSACMVPLGDDGEPITITSKTPQQGALDLPAAGGAVDPELQAQDAEMIDELTALLANAGLGLDEVIQYSEADLVELLKDELKVSVVKRNRMKDAVARRKAGTQAAKHADPAAGGPPGKKDPFDFMAE